MMSKLLHIVKIIINYFIRPKNWIAQLSIKFVGFGVVLTVGGVSFKAEVSKSFLEKYAPFIDTLSLGYQALSEVVFWIGILLIASGFILGLLAVYLIIKEGKNRDIALISASGFTNFNPTAAVDSLSSNEKNKTVPITFPTIDSRQRNSVLRDIAFYQRTIQERVYHKETKYAYICAIGSVPYLFALGTCFRDGHLPITHFEHERTKNKYHRLDDFPTNRALVSSFRGSVLTDFTVITADANGKIGVAISFSLKINDADIPEELRNHTLHLKLDGGYRFDNLPNEEEQARVASEISNIIAQLNKNADEVHLFISAQASLVLRLGTLYQQGVHGKLTVHHWDVSSNKYLWHLCILGDDVF